MYDGKDRACPGEAFVAHELLPGETYELSIELHRADDARWWLAASVALLGERGAGSRALGSMRLAVDEPCWLDDGTTGNALVVVIPAPDAGASRDFARVALADFAWR